MNRIPPVEDVHVDRDVPVTMRDGVTLMADVYRPVVGGAVWDRPLPVLLERTPYDRSGLVLSEISVADPAPRTRQQVASTFARAGYVVMLQDCRGRYGSEGVFTKYVNEAADGVDTLAWIGRQPWCDGQVGTYGLSYCAHVQMAAACQNPPHLACMVMDSGGFAEAYRAGIRQGGAFELKQLTWAYRQALVSPAVEQDPALRAAIEAEDIADWVKRWPWREGHSPLAALPEFEAYVLEQARHGEFDDYWRQMGLGAARHYAAMADVPTLLLCSWYDPYASSTLENYQGMRARKHGPTHLIMGPWTHGRRSESFAGDVDFGTAATLDGSLAPDYDTLRLRWFDRWLKGAWVAEDAPVRVFIMGGGSGARRPADGRLDHGGAWVDAPQWPLAGVTPTTYHLHADGRLDPAAPAAGPASLAYEYDPARPVPTLGGATASGAPVMEAGAFDQATLPGSYAATPPFGPLADRDDVLVFETAPLARDIVLAGTPEAVLHVSSDRLDTDFTVKLVDVHPPSADYPRGYAMNLAHGILRTRYRQGWERPVMMEAGEIYELTIPFFPTANRFKAGHRIRVEVSSSNFPHFDANLPDRHERSCRPVTSHPP
ncbi:CocE/NonD family hydrolase [Azospirillum sp. B4]|uniref:CocE/NonD family hydrolase n=1 Tax=Azospirillum sp. B4 TaxID=95605 RepID=UPI00034CD0B4|nr:CocE/NonD family hydrolase [Azospirillum sp. B4]